jgi:hypothetical protein
MRTFAQKQNQSPKPVFSSLARSNMATPAPPHREMLQPHAEDAEESNVGLTDETLPRFGHDFSQIPIHTPARAIQTKLAISQPGDEYEQEAARIADQVMTTPMHHLVSGGPTHIQRFTGQSNGQIDAEPASVDHALAGPGRPLEPTLRQDMEQRFGHDFSRVRVHSDSAAQQSARDLNAKAYTVGHDIVLDSRHFMPETHDGRRLLAHELTHVIQQFGSDGTSFRRGNLRADSSPLSSAATTALRTPMPVRQLQRDTVQVPLHPEETGTFTGSFKLPAGEGLFP